MAWQLTDTASPTETSVTQGDGVRVHRVVLDDLLAQIQNGGTLYNGTARVTIEVTMPNSLPQDTCVFGNNGGLGGAVSVSVAGSDNWSNPNWTGGNPTPLT